MRNDLIVSDTKATYAILKSPDMKDIHSVVYVNIESMGQCKKDVIPR